ncbi:SRPBCC domain-containing protein [Streptomyces marincola]|uniref:SRPBCC domain-containing protein n=1 Tax=Streptomyces marincola TaxID=2878388 RepID=UPI001CF5434A|nr:SRPBCC domain-containing protein [Streptomyces marincola]UCM90963.1 SRPBCC domain-containing protein [Streptomyces marincola]
MTHSLPQQPAQGALGRAADGRWSLSLDREFAHPVADVWAALTEARQVPRWAPFIPSRDLDAPGPVDLPERPGEAPARGEVRVVEPPRLLVLDWDEDELRFELTPTGRGTLLRFVHTFADRPQAASYAAGWHLCLAALTGLLDGLDLPRVVGAEAREHGWEPLHAEYTGLFGEG